MCNQFVKKGLLCLLCIYPFLLSGQNTSKPTLVIPYGHHYGIQKTLFAKNNELLVTSDEAFTIVSDVRSGKPLFYFSGVNPSVSTDGKYVATISDSFAYVWQTDGGKLISKIKVNGECWKTQLPASEPIIVIQYKSSNAGKENPAGLFFDVAVWDFNSNKQLGLFESENSKLKSGCNECLQNTCPIYGFFFTPSTDSLKLIFNSSIQSYNIRTLNNPQTVCLKTGDNFNNGGVLKSTLLANNCIEVYTDKSGMAFDETGNFLCSWDKASDNELTTRPTELVSLNGKFVLQYTSDKILLRDNDREIQKTYSAKGLKKISFNKKNNFLLIEFLNEMPRFFSVPKFEETDSLSNEDKEGFPEYVYVTQTEEAPELRAMFGSLKNILPKKPKILTKLNKWGVTDIDPFASMDQMMNGMENDANSTYTNTGQIFNLFTKRKISKIQSLIKLTGDIAFSPDNKTMLLNTGKYISVYSIPYAKNLINLPYSLKESMMFSTDSKWLTHYSLTFSADTSILSIINLETGSVKNILQFKKPASFPEVFIKDNNSKVLIQFSNGEYSLFDIQTGNLLETGESKYHFISTDGNKTGIINLSKNSLEISLAMTPGRTYTISLPEIKKEKKKKNTEEQPLIYKARFAAHSNALVVYNVKQLIYYSDFEKANDTLQFNSEKQDPIPDNIVISANGRFLKLQFPNGRCIVLDTKNRSNALLLGENDDDETDDPEKLKARVKNVGLMIRKISNGNFEGIKKDIAKFSETGDSVLVSYQNKISLYASDKQSPLNERTFDGDIKYFSQEANLVIEDYHGELKFKKLNEQKDWFSMIPFKNGDCVYLLPDGTYFGSKSSTRHLGYLSGDKSLSYKQFDFVNNRPDIVLTQLGNNDHRYISIYDSAYRIRKRRDGIKDSKTVGNMAAPDITYINADKINGEVKDSVLNLQVQIKSTGQLADRLSVYINGNPLYGSRGLKLIKKQAILTENLRIPLSEGSNYIEISAFDVLGQEGYRRPFNVQYRPIQKINTTVYFVGLGAAEYTRKEKNLTWAKKDITAMLDILSAKYGSNMQVDTLFNQQITAGKLSAIRKKLEKSKINDLVIIYYSGHGEIDTLKAEAFFGTYDMDFNNPSSRGLSIRDFNDLTDGISARNKAIFIDACHSGEINPDAWKSKQTADKIQAPVVLTPATSDEELTKLTIRKGGNYKLANPQTSGSFDLALELFTDLYQGNGTNIIAAARGLQAAKECPEFEHGVFTFCALKGISNLSADEDKNAELSIGELRSFIIDKVSSYSVICKDDNTIQQAVSRKENEFNDWIIINNRDSLTKAKSEFILTDDGKEKPFTKGKRIFNDIKNIMDIKNEKPKGSLKKRLLNAIN